MKTFFVFVLGILTVVFAEDSPSSPPIVKQFEVDAYNKVIRPYDQVDGKRNEIIVEKVDHLRLECHSSYPVQWIYTGSGVCGDTSNNVNRLNLFFFCFVERFP